MKQNTKEIVFQQELSKDCVSFETSLEAKVNFLNKFKKNHLPDEIETLRSKTEIIDNKIINTIFFEREETDSEYTDRILKERATREHFKKKVESFQNFLDDHWEIAEEILLGHCAFMDEGNL